MNHGRRSAASAFFNSLLDQVSPMVQEETLSTHSEIGRAVQTQGYYILKLKNLKGAAIRSLTFCSIRGFENLRFLRQADFFRAL
jgi:hypothetical protein